MANIEFTAQLEQSNREKNVTGPGFFYLVSGQDVNFSVKGLVDESWSGTPVNTYGTKYAVTNKEQFEAEFATTVSGLDDGDIVIRRNTEWEIYLDVSNPKVSGVIVFNEHDGKFYYWDPTVPAWTLFGTGAAGGGGSPGGPQWAVQFNYNESLSGSSKFRFDESGNKVVLGSDVKIEFGDGTTQSTARNFFAATGPTTESFPRGFSGAGNTGDRLLVATGPSADPFRNYVKFGGQWFQYGVAGIASGPRGADGSPGAAGATGATGVTGVTGATGVGLTSVGLSGDTGILRAKYVNSDGTLTDYFDVGYVRGTTGATGISGGTGSTGATGYVFGVNWIYVGSQGTGALGTKGLSDDKIIAFLDGNPSLMYINKTSLSGINYLDWIQSWDDSTNNGIQGYLVLNRRESGLTGDIIFDVTAVDVAAYYTNLYQITGTIRGGSVSNIPTDSIVSVNFIPAGNRGEVGSTGATGFTGGTGATGVGLTAVGLSGDTGILRAKYVNSNGSLTDYFDIGYVRGETGTTGTTGSTGSTGATGATGVGLTAVGLSGNTGILRAKYVNSDGSLTDYFDIGYARGETGATGASITGSTGATGENAGLRYVFTLGDSSAITAPNRNTTAPRHGDLALNLAGTQLFMYTTDVYKQSHSSYLESWDDSDSFTKGHVHITQRAKGIGKTGHIVFAVQSVVSTLGNGYSWSGVLVSGTTGQSIDIGNDISVFLAPAGYKGGTGATGATGESGLTGFEPNNSELLRNAATNSTSFSTSGFGGSTARKVLFLEQDGSITAGYLLNYNVFSASDFLFQITDFDRTFKSAGQTGASIRRLSNNFYSLGGANGVTFTASYIGTPATAGIAILNGHGQNNPIYFPTAGMDVISGVNHSMNITGIGGSSKISTIRLSVTGSNYGNTRNQTSSYTVKFRNDYLYGTTGGSSISSFSSINLNRDFNSSKPEAQTINEYEFAWNATAGAEPYYVYFAYPKRMHIERTDPSDGVLFYNKESGAPSYGSEGGWVLQGYGEAAEGASTVSYTNPEGYVEDYKVWRTINSGLGAMSTFVITGGAASYTP